MLKVIKDAKIIICMGSGGVGKTTVAATIGYLAAQMGRKTLVLTIDPSKRLKTTLKIAEGGAFTELKLSGLKASLHAGMIDSKKTFDEFVRKAARREELAQKILQNKLYIQLSTTLSGSQEFTALEKLYSSSQSGEFDLVVLDTPPAQHAIEFLAAPEKLRAMFNERITKWFRQSDKEKGMLASLLHSGTKKVLQVLEMLTGSDFIRELSDFFVNIQSWQGQLEERIIAVQKLLLQSSTQFVLVTGFDIAKLKEAEYLSREIKKGGYQFSDIIINRSFPLWLDLQGDRVKGISHPLVSLYNEMQNYFRERNQNYLNFIKKIGDNFQVTQLPEFENDISDLDGIAELSAYLKGEDPG